LSHHPRVVGEACAQSRVEVVDAKGHVLLWMTSSEHPKIGMHGALRTMNRRPQSAVGSTSSVPPQWPQRDREENAGTVALSDERPQAKQYKRYLRRDARRCAARSSADGPIVSPVSW